MENNMCTEKKQSETKGRPILGIYSTRAGVYYSKPSEIAEVARKIFNTIKLKKQQSK